MPIYEFYCEKCNTIYKFLSRRINTDTVPACPACKDFKLSRKMSLFTAVSGKKEKDVDGMPPIDEGKMEKAISILTKEAGDMKDDDPRRAAQLMRKISDAAGLKMGSGMEEALSRLEKGESPEKIEQDMGEIFESEDPFTFQERKKQDPGQSEPNVDETLYDL